MKLFILFYLFIVSSSLATETLSLVSPLVNKIKQGHPIQTEVALNGNFLKVSFEITTDQINAKPVFQKNEYPFQFDVVELFLSVEDGLYPYYEFEVSPFNQTFVVKIEAPKKFINNFPAEWIHSAELTPRQWQAEMTIDLSKLGWQGDISKIKGNLYAITGKSPNRYFWGLSLPKMKKANFHSPQYFLPLVKQ